MRISGYSKIWGLGHREVLDIFEDEVIIEEKIDGSQFSFGFIDGKLLCRSRGMQQDVEAPDNLFIEAIETAKSIDLPDGFIVRCEYLKKPKHNVLAYDRIPEKNLIVFDVDRSDQAYMNPSEKESFCKIIGLECVPMLYRGKVNNFDEFMSLLEKQSVLGGQTVEGVVIKNYNKYTNDKKIMMAKFVNEAFKEKHKKDWKVTTGKNIIEIIGDSLRTEARWEKAVQHLRERGELFEEAKDIGALFKEVSSDVLEEESDYIKEKLLDWAWKNISKIVTKGLPEWYKEKLAKKSFK